MMFGFSRKTTSSRNLRGGGEVGTAASIESGSPPNGPHQAGSPSGRFNPAAFALLAAAQRGDVGEVARLLAMRASSTGQPMVNMNDRDEMGRTALHAAAAAGHLDVVRALVETHGADMNPFTNPLPTSSPSSSSSSPPKAGAGIDEEERKVLGRKTPLYMALQAQRFEAAHYLLTKGAAVATVTADAPATSALHLAAQNCPITTTKDGETSAIAATKAFTDLAVMSIMLLGSTNQQDELGNTALHYAVERGHMPLVNLLLKHQADPNIMNKEGNTSLLLAIKGGRREVSLAILASVSHHHTTPEPPVAVFKTSPAGKEREQEAHQTKGWLKKKIQASDKSKIKKKWQKRYVEIKQSSLVYFKNQQQASPSYEVDLTNTSLLVSSPYNKLFPGVEEIPTDSNHPYVFVIKLDRKKDQGRIAESGSGIKRAKAIYLSASSEDELLQWVNSINAVKQVRAPERHSLDPKHDAKVVLVLKRVAKFFSDDDRRESIEGLLDESIETSLDDESELSSERRSSSFTPLYSPELWNADKANQSDLDMLGSSLLEMQGVNGTSFDFRAVTSPYSIFHFMLAMLKEMTTSLLTIKLEPLFLSAAGLVDPSKRLDEYRTLLHKSNVPSVCMQALRQLLPLLFRLETHHLHNGMTLERIAELFIPVFLRGRMEKTLQESIRERYLARLMIEDFVRHYERLFEEKPEEGKDALATKLDSEHSQLQRRVGSQGLLYLLDQEVEAIRLRWEEVKNIGRGESDSRLREWEKTIPNVSALAAGIHAEVQANESMLARLHASVAESQAAIDAMQPHWDTEPTSE